MDVFKKTETPDVRSDMPTEGLAQSQQAVPPIQLMPGAGGLTQMVERTLELEQENNRILKNMQAMDRWSLGVKVVFWALVLGLPLLFYQQIMDFTTKAISENPTFLGLPPGTDIQGLFDTFKAE